jgi:protein TonB
MEIKKSKRADLSKERGTSLMIGLIISLSIMFVALEWTQRDEVDDEVAYTAVTFAPEEMIPITLPEKKTVPPPPAAVTKADIIEIVDDDADIDDEILASTEDNTPWLDPQEYEVIMVEPEPDPDEIHIAVEEVPEFPGGVAALMAYLRKNIKYPAICRENNIQGKVIVTFVVNKDGSIVDVEVAKGVNPALDKEAVRVISQMPNWQPGRQLGRPVRVRYSVPVSFRLN